MVLDRGISCECCHGPGEQHIKLMKAGSKTTGIVNPTKLPALQRDSICAQCHLSGEARIEKPGRSLLTFRPGDALSDHVLSFVSSNSNNEAVKATGHVEKLWQSKCKQISGEKLSCTTCHNPHETQPKANAANYFNPKCATCHQDNACKEDIQLRTQAQNNCIGCHMPKSPTEHIGHNVFTNHAIPRRANATAPASSNDAQFKTFWGTATTRDLGLAYLSAASRTKDANYLRATELLKKAEPTLKNDAYALTALAKMYEREKNVEAATRCYELALQSDPAQTEAAVNLGTLYARQSKLADAVRLWEDVLKRNPGYEIARINLAVAHLENGNFETARKTLLKALEYDPDLPMVRKLLADLEAIKK
jgi:predicted Zn-dependent protease